MVGVNGMSDLKKYVISQGICTDANPEKFYKCAEADKAIKSLKAELAGAQGKLNRVRYFAGGLSKNDTKAINQILDEG